MRSAGDEDGEGTPDSGLSLGLAIDRRGDVPIGVQLAWMMRARIGDGTLAPGQRLPGLRELALEMGVNINTVRSVYQRLEGEGLIDSQQGVGTFVAREPPRRSPVGAIAAEAAREARMGGVDPREVAAALYVAPTDAPGERRRDLRAQIGMLERAIIAMETEHPGVAPARAPASSKLGPTLLSTGELEQVRTELVRRLSTVQSAIDSAAAQPKSDPANATARAEARDRARSRRQAGKRSAASTPAPLNATTTRSANKPARRGGPSRPATAES
jgi:DNA-binding transcriptional regulator YhcF (GntR family)